MSDFSVSNDLSTAAHAVRALIDAPAVDRSAQLEAIATMLDTAADRVRAREAAMRKAVNPLPGVSFLRSRRSKAGR